MDGDVVGESGQHGEFIGKFIFAINTSFKG